MPYNFQILGTVIASVLEYDHLIKITGDPAVVNPKTSVWIPADGRSIDKSELSNQTGLKSAPDLRGKFLRGLNTFYNNGQPALVIDQADVDDPQSKRIPGMDYQGDSFRLHGHSASGHINGSVCGSNGTHDVDGGSDKWNCDPSFGDHNVVVSIQPFGGSETRPKNIGVYYYIKIN